MWGLKAGVVVWKWTGDLEPLICLFSQRPWQRRYRGNKPASVSVKEWGKSRKLLSWVLIAQWTTSSISQGTMKERGESRMGKNGNTADWWEFPCRHNGQAWINWVTVAWNNCADEGQWDIKIQGTRRRWRRRIGWHRNEAQGNWEINEVYIWSTDQTNV